MPYPIYFVDFETVNRAIPRFTGMRPYSSYPSSVRSICRRNEGHNPNTMSFSPWMPAIPGMNSLGRSRRTRRARNHSRV